MREFGVLEFKDTRSLATVFSASMLAILQQYRKGEMMNDRSPMIFARVTFRFSMPSANPFDGNYAFLLPFLIL